MKIERISDNQIRCTLTSLDLSSRGINLTELAYGSEKARNLFHEMIQQAAKEVPASPNFHLLRKQNRKIFYPSWQMNFWKAPGIWKNFWGKMDLLA